MKKLVAVLLLAAFSLCGCARHYTITLNDGTQLGAVGKPKVKNGRYEFKDAMGNPRAIPIGRVSEVSPASMATGDEKSQFKPSGS